MRGPAGRTGPAEPAGPEVRFVPLQRGATRVVAAWEARTRRRRPVVLIVPGLLHPPGTLFGWMYRLARGGVVAATLEQMPSPDRNAPGGLAGALERLVASLVAQGREALEALAELPVAEPGRAALVGVSAGGWAALRLAERRGGAGTTGVRVEAVAAVLSGPGWRRIPGGAGRLLEELGVPAWGDEAGAEVDPGRCPLLHPGDAGERARRLEGCALLLVAGGRDPVVDPEEVKGLYRELVAHLPRASERLQLVVYPGLDHRLTPPLQDRVSSWVLWMLGAGGLAR